MRIFQKLNPTTATQHSINFMLRGAHFLDDIKELKVDKALTTPLKIKNIPTANVFSKYLRKHGTNGEEGMR
jgi:hypothetical protein